MPHELDASDCVWHLHLVYDDGSEACQTEIYSRAYAEIALESDEAQAARDGRRIVKHSLKRCATDLHAVHNT
jgi:hypothetical protein